MRLGFCYVRGLRESAAQALLREREKRLFTSIDDLARRVPELRENELTALAEVGALNSIPGSQFPVPSKCHREGERIESEGSMYSLKNCIDPSSGWRPPQDDTGQNHKSQIANRNFHRRDALWQVARAARGAGELLRPIEEADGPSPLEMMTTDERLVADFRGTGVTVGPHPMAYRRAEFTAQGIRRAIELEKLPNGKFVKVAGCVIARQRPGTAHGFVFLSLEDETGIANAIVTPDLFDRYRLPLIAERFLLVEGRLQHQDNVISVKVERMFPLQVTAAETRSHDFH